MRMPRIVRWALEMITFSGVMVTTGCPHCGMVAIGTIGAVEYACAHKTDSGN
jgi:hypothetical protein